MNTDPQTLLGRYKLVKVLGRGAMGVVYEATDTRLSRTVAIKTVLRSFSPTTSTSADYTARFEREAQAAARLNHPHIVAVFDFGEQDDVSFIVMEFVRGRELGQALAEGEKFSLEETVRIMGELLDALAYAHEHGIVHRDVKPANVMIDGAGRVKLTDFGVARLADTNQDRTLPGTMVGTPSYMAPEQILGLAVGSRADIFGAGVVLYQFLTGTRPFVGGGPFGVQRKIVHDEPVPPSQVNPSVPAGFDAIVSRALAKQPEDRYDTAAAFAADLRRMLRASQPAAPDAAPDAALDFDLDSTVVMASGQTLPPATAVHGALLHAQAAGPTHAAFPVAEGGARCLAHGDAERASRPCLPRHHLPCRRRADNRGDDHGDDRAAASHREDIEALDRRRGRRRCRGGRAVAAGAAGAGGRPGGIAGDAGGVGGVGGAAGFGTAQSCLQPLRRLWRRSRLTVHLPPRRPRPAPRTGALPLQRRRRRPPRRCPWRRPPGPRLQRRRPGTQACERRHPTRAATTCSCACSSVTR